MFYMKGEGRSTMMEGTDISQELSRKLDIILANKESIKKRLERESISPDRRQCLEYQLKCLEKPISRITVQLNGAIA